MANEIYQQGGDNKLVCAVWNTDIPSHKNEYKVEVSTVFVSFFVPVIVMLFPFIALLMQVCGGRQPRYNYLVFLLLYLISIVHCFLKYNSYSFYNSFMIFQARSTPQ